MILMICFFLTMSSIQNVKKTYTPMKLTNISPEHFCLSPEKKKHIDSNSNPIDLPRGPKMRHRFEEVYQTEHFTVSTSPLPPPQEVPLISHDVSPFAVTPWLVFITRLGPPSPSFKQQILASTRDSSSRVLHLTHPIKTRNICFLFFC